MIASILSTIGPFIATVNSQIVNTSTMIYDLFNTRTSNWRQGTINILVVNINNGEES